MKRQVNKVSVSHSQRPQTQAYVPPCACSGCETGLTYGI
jgi:hypothetical protein